MCSSDLDIDVLKETVPDLAGKPANLVRFPRRRDKAWLELFDRYPGKIGEAFAFEAFTMPPLAAFPSCDAKFTTAKLAERLESWALFGPPLGRTWDPTPEDRKKYPDAKPLVSNDWVILGVTPPSVRPENPETAEAEPVDLEPFPDEEKEVAVKFEAIHPFAWRGTLLPQSERDIWLASAFAEYEKVIALEQALKLETAEKSLKLKPTKDTAAKSNPPAEKALCRASRDLVDLALFAHESSWHFAARRLGRDVALGATKSDPAKSEWYEIAKGKGVMLLAALRSSLGGALFDRLMDEFGQAHAGAEVATSEFVAHFHQGAGKPADEVFASWLDAEPAGNRSTPGEAFTIHSFEPEPEPALIVRGTLGDRAAQREAAEHLQRTLARRFSNFTIPIKADTEVDDSELSQRHVLLVGRPATNRVAAHLAKNMAVSFGPASFSVRDEKYAHPDSAVVVAADNPLNRRYSLVVYAGLSAEATWKCVQHLDSDELPPPQVLVHPAGRKPLRFRVTGSAATVVDR